MAKQDLYLAKPLLNAPGFLGFSPNPRGIEAIARFDGWGGCGAFVTDPISWRARSPAENAVYTEVDGQVFLHTGHPNRGFRSVIKAVAPKWARSPLPIIPSIWEPNPDQVFVMLRELEQMDNLAAVNLMPPMQNIPDMQVWLSAFPRLIAEIPIILTLPTGLIPFYGNAFANAGASAILPAAPRGLITLDGQFVSGRLYGPTHFPGALSLARTCSLAGIPLIASGGINTQDKFNQAIAEGVVAGAIDILLWQ